MSTIDKAYVFLPSIYDIYDSSLSACQYVNISYFLAEESYTGEVHGIFSRLQ